MENTKILTEAQIEALENLSEIIRKIVDSAVDLVKTMWPIIVRICKKILEMYNNKRVIHLATKHGNPRVRKKNIHRIAKWVRRVKCKE